MKGQSIRQRQLNTSMIKPWHWWTWQTRLPLQPWGWEWSGGTAQCPHGSLTDWSTLAGYGETEEKIKPTCWLSIGLNNNGVLTSRNTTYLRWLFTCCERLAISYSCTAVLKNALQRDSKALLVWWKRKKLTHQKLPFCQRLYRNKVTLLS